MRQENLGRYDTAPSPQDQEALLMRRLDDGYERIEQAIAKGENVSHWEEFWLDLLHQYEALCDQMDAGGTQ